MLFDNKDSLRISLLDEPDLGNEELQAKALLNINFHLMPPEWFFGELVRLLNSDFMPSAKSHQLVSLNKTELVNIINNGELDHALEILMTYTRKNESSTHLSEELLDLSNKLNQLNKGYRLDRISSDVAWRAQDSIASHLFEIIKHLPV